MWKQETQYRPFSSCRFACVNNTSVCTEQMILNKNLSYLQDYLHVNQTHFIFRRRNHFEK